MEKENRNIKIRRIAALIGVIAIGIMILATLLTAFLDKSGIWFRSCLIVTIALPIALWVCLWAWGAMLNRHTAASFDLGGTENADAEKDAVNQASRDIPDRDADISDNTEK